MGRALKKKPDRSGPFEVIHDTQPPRTALEVGTPAFATSISTFVAPATLLGLVAEDDLLDVGDRIGLGVRETRFAVDSELFDVLRASFTLSEGTHTVSFFSFDVASNAESVRTARVDTDGTPPQTALTLQGGRQVPGPDPGSFFASTDTVFGFLARDVVVKGAASGVRLTEFQINQGPLQAFSSALPLPEGIERLGYRSQDNVLNLEVLRSTTALVDGTPPRSRLTVDGRFS